MKRDVKDAHIYFPARVLKDIKRIAERNRRTVTAEVVIAVESYIAESKSENGRPAAGKGREK